MPLLTPPVTHHLGDGWDQLGVGWGYDQAQPTPTDGKPTLPTFPRGMTVL